MHNAMHPVDTMHFTFKLCAFYIVIQKYTRFRPLEEK